MSAFVLASNFFLWPVQFPLLGFDGIGLNFALTAPLALGYFKLPSRARRYLSIFLAILLVHSIAIMIAGKLNFRAFFMAIALFAFLAGTCVALRSTLEDNFDKFSNMVLTLMCAQTILCFLELAGIFDLYEGWSRPHYFFNFDVPTGFFREASHVAISVAPLTFFWLSTRLTDKYIAVLAALAVFLTLSTTGLAIFLLLGLIFAFRSTSVSSTIKKSILLVVVCILSYYLANSASLQNVNERIVSIAQLLNGSGSLVSNLSAIIYANGASMAIQGLNSIIGAGSGQMFLYYQNAPYTPLIEALTNGTSLNVNDGGSTMFKVIAEFGYLGIAFLIMYFSYVVKAARSNFSPYLLVMASYFLVTAIRGAAYFDGPGMISIALLMLSGLRIDQTKDNNIADSIKP